MVKIDFDEHLTFGRFQKKLCLLFFVATLFAESTWYACISFLVDSVEGQWGLSDSQSGLYPSCLFSGQLFGSIVLSRIADSHGARVVA